MSPFEAFLLGALQGIAEFLPISSSGHLALLQMLFGLEESEHMLLFDVFLHLGTLAAVCVVLRKDIKALLQLVGKLFTKAGRASLGQDATLRLLVLLVLATLPLLIIIPFKGYIEGLMASPVFIGFMLLLTGLVLQLTDLVPKGGKTEKTARVTDVLFVGLMQGLAVVPGLSRSGMTISGGLFRGFDRRFAFRLSFLMSLPAILGATVLEVGDAIGQPFDPSLILPILIGTVTAALLGCASLILVNRLVLSKHFSKFSWYCLLVGAITLFVGIVK